MIFKLRFCPWVLLMMVPGMLLSQDIHFTQFNLAPLSFNPAMTGGFYGSIRVGGIYRDQWGSAYNTPAFFIDSPILRGLRKQDWIGVGMFLARDEAESEYLPFDNTSSKRGSVTTGGALMSGAYHFALDKERNTVIALGVQGGTLSKKLDGEFEFEDAIISGGPSMDQLPDSESPNNYLDISAGLTLTGKTSGTSYYRLGLSAMHVNKPKASILGGGGASASIPMRMVGFGTFHMDINETFLFNPSILFQSMGPASEVALQGMVGYKIPAESLILKGGLGYRLGDALEVLVGLDYKDFRVGASYDVTLSSLQAPNNAFELGVTYIARIYKRPKIDPVIFCPRF